jgi:hypothetical protein
VCKEKFTPRFSTLQATCEKPSCLIEYSQKVKKKEWAAEKKEWKEKIKPASEWRRELQAVFNTFIRMRDKGTGCISCARPLGNKYDAGHYYSVGSYPNLRYHEHNVHGQCVYCNRDKHGNLIAYREGLISRIGLDRLNELDAKSSLPLNITIPDIKDMIQHYRARIKEIKNM